MLPTSRRAGTRVSGKVRRPVLPHQRLLSVAQVAAELGMAEITIWHKVYAREISSVKIGRSRRIPRTEVERMIERGTTKRAAIA